MKKTLALVFLCVIIGGALWANPCASRDYDTRNGAVLGAIGGDTAGTLPGAAGGALVGATAANVVEQTDTAVRLAQAQPPGAQGYGPPPPGAQGYGPPPPGAQGYGPPPPEEAPPPYAFAAPPDVVPIPGTYAYFVPGMGADILFYGGYWYRPFRGRWYGAPSYNGPWMYVPGPRVPRVLLSLPPGWRRVPPGYRPIPHAELNRNWQRWQREKHWEGHR
jgi:hypothetical protein